MDAAEAKSSTPELRRSYAKGYAAGRYKAMGEGRRYASPPAPVSPPADALRPLQRRLLELTEQLAAAEMAESWGVYETPGGLVIVRDGQPVRPGDPKPYKGPPGFVRTKT